MRQVMVRHKVKPERVAENEQLVCEAYEELDRTRPDGLRYGTFWLELCGWRAGHRELGRGRFGYWLDG
jgi:hypothetical protein